MRILTIVAIAVPVLLVGGLGAGFLSLGANALPPAQVAVHKDFPAGRFAAKALAPSLSSLMPQPSAPASMPAAAPVGTPPPTAH